MIPLFRALPWLLAGAALLGGPAACAQSTDPDNTAPRSVLFVGNSLTYVNDLPATLARVATAAGGTVRVGMAAAPDLAVIDHTNGATDAVAQIDKGHYSFVVLQQGPTPEGMCRDTLVMAAMRLDPHVRAAGGRTVMFLPWVRQGVPGSLGWAGETATLAARATGGVVAPVGVAWRNALAADASLPLYGADGYHPAPAGTLLAALTIYERLFGGDVRELSADAVARLSSATLSAAQARVLAAAAHDASAAQAPDPDSAVPADTTHVSTSGGPC